MKKQIKEERSCPRCGEAKKQYKKGYNHSGTQRCICNECGVSYTIDPKKREYPEDTKQQAIKMYYSGVSGRGVGKVLGFSKANVYNWIKKTERTVDK